MKPLSFVIRHSAFVIAASLLSSCCTMKDAARAAMQRGFVISYTIHFALALACLALSGCTAADRLAWYELTRAPLLMTREEQFVCRILQLKDDGQKLVLPQP